MWKDFFYFSRRERQGILFLLVFIAGIFIGKFVFSSSEPEMLKESELAEESASFVDSSETPESTYIPSYEQKQTKPRENKYNPPPQREKRTYYVQERDTIVRPVHIYPKIEKLSKGETIELNTADSVSLRKLPGIGPAFARRILTYKKELGGYHRIEQLQEVREMYEELYEQIVPYLTLNPNEIVRIPVNTASLDQLKNHPYIGFYKALAIIEIRKKKGRLEGIDDLKLLEEFSSDDWIRIEPYLEFQSAL
jgi:DNA uptake protein ComE-like DNA-binding protein